MREAMNRNRRKPIQVNERGIVSIMLTVVIILVVSLIVLGLAQISRREQRQSTDNQLSAQAFYAAESGVNDAAEKLSGMVGMGTVPDKTTCGNDATYTFSSVIDGAAGISYPCLLIEPNPTDLTLDLSSESQVLPLRISGGAALGSIKLSWTKPDGIAGNYTSCPSNTDHVFAPNNGFAWSCPYGMLRVDLVATKTAAGAITLNRTSLLNNTMTLFIVPTRAGGAGNATMSFRTGASAAAANGCSTACQLNITGLGGKEYYIRVTEIYRTGGMLTISRNGGGGFEGAQALIDVTGKAQDVLRRIRVAVDISGSNSNRAAVGAVMSGESVCKQFYTYSETTYPNACP